MTVIAAAELADPLPVLELIERARVVDGAAAVNEAGRLALTAHPSTGRVHLVAGPADHPVGYAGIELPPDTGLTDSASPDVVGAEIVVDPATRGRGIGSALLQAAGELAARERPGAVLAVWAHHDSAAARRLALAAGMTESRTLLLLERPSSPLPPLELPPGVRFAPFRPGTDEQAWLAVNAAAFAFHPEQGAWTLADVRARETEPWFDPAGFLLAWPAGDPPSASAAAAAAAVDPERLLGFNWTKVADAGPGPAVGEIYVLAVAPGAGVRGLGTALAVAGLEHLHHLGVDTVELYVEADNGRALSLYRRLGFLERSRDVRWTMAPAVERPQPSGA